MGTGRPRPHHARTVRLQVIEEHRRYLDLLHLARFHAQLVVLRQVAQPLAVNEVDGRRPSRVASSFASAVKLPVVMRSPCLRGRSSRRGSRGLRLRRRFPCGACTGRRLGSSPARGYIHRCHRSHRRRSSRSRSLTRTQPRAAAVAPTARCRRADTAKHLEQFLLPISTSCFVLVEIILSLHVSRAQARRYSSSVRGPSP